eukprot:Opistho-2@71538
MMTMGKTKAPTSHNTTTGKRKLDSLVDITNTNTASHPSTKRRKPELLAESRGENWQANGENERPQSIDFDRFRCNETLDDEANEDVQRVAILPCKRSNSVLFVREEDLSAVRDGIMTSAGATVGATTTTTRKTTTTDKLVCMETLDSEEEEGDSVDDSGDRDICDVAMLPQEAIAADASTEQCALAQPPQSPRVVMVDLTGETPPLGAVRSDAVPLMRRVSDAAESNPAPTPPRTIEAHRSRDLPTFKSAAHSLNCGSDARGEMSANRSYVDDADKENCSANEGAAEERKRCNFAPLSKHDNESRCFRKACQVCPRVRCVLAGVEDPSLDTPGSSAILCEMRAVQAEYLPREHYLRYHRHITDKMRRILVDWLVEVQISFKLCDETLFLAVSMVDRYLSKRRLPRDRLQLVGATALFIASKYEEVGPPTLGDFVYVCADSYSREEFKAMEQKMLSVLSYRVSAPTALFFLQSFAPILGAKKMQLMVAEYGLQLALLKYELTTCLATTLACAALVFAAHTTDDIALVRHAEKLSGAAHNELPGIVAAMKKSAASCKSTCLKAKFETNSKLNVSTIHFASICA